MSTRNRSILSAFLLLSVAGVSRAQTSQEHLERFTPDRARFFARMDLFDRLYDRFHQADALEAFGLAEELDAERTGQPKDWADVWEYALGLKADDILRNLFGREVALAAPDWQRLEEGIVIARLQDRDVVNRVLKARQGRQVEARGKVKTYRLANGLHLATDGRFLIIANHTGPGSFFVRSVQLLGGSRHRSLAGQRRFQRVVGELPEGYRAVLFVDLSGRKDGSLAVPIIKGLKQVAVGLYERRDGVDLDVRVHGIISGSQKSGGVPMVAVARLPEDTLGVWATSVDFSSCYANFKASHAAGFASFYIGMIEQSAGEGNLQKVLGDLGPHTMFVWGQPQEATGAIPLISAVIESEKPDEVVEAIAGAVDNVRQMVNFVSPAGEQAEFIKHVTSEHHGVTIHSLHMKPDDEGATTTIKMLGSLRVSFASADGTVIVSTHSEHLRHLLDARRGEVAKIGQMKVFDAIRGAGPKVSSVFLAQPSASCEVLNGWLDYVQLHLPQLVDADWWSRRAARSKSPVRLGIGMREVPEHPGKIVVAGVKEGWPAYNRLKPADLIVGINDQLLSLDDPRGDMKRRVFESADSTIRFRVERDGSLLDVEVPIGRTQKSGPMQAVDPISAIKQLGRLCRPFSYAAFSIGQSDADSIHAHAVFRFQPGAVPLMVGQE